MKFPCGQTVGENADPVMLEFPEARLRASVDHGTGACLFQLMQEQRQDMSWGFISVAEPWDKPPGLASRVLSQEGWRDAEYPRDFAMDECFVLPPDEARHLYEKLRQFYGE